MNKINFYQKIIIADSQCQLKVLSLAIRRVIDSPVLLGVRNSTFMLALSFSGFTQAGATIDVATAGELNQAIQSANSQDNSYAGTNTLALQEDITLSSELPTIKSPVIIDGSGCSNSSSSVDNCVLKGNKAFSLLTVDSTGTLTVQNTTLTEGGGENGGAISNLGGTVTIKNSSITGCSVSQFGGAVTNDEQGTVVISNSILSGNTAAKGGAVSNKHTKAKLTVIDSTITGNSATDEGGGIHNYNTAYSSVTGSTISYNTAKYGGGLQLNNAKVALKESTITGNTAYDSGGGIYIKKGATYVQNGTEIKGNSSSNHGGGIHIKYGYLQVNQSTVSGNTSGSKGGGIYNHHGKQDCVYYACTSATSSSGYIHCTCAIESSTFAAKVKVENSTISGNTSTDDGAGIMTSSDNTIIIKNSTIANNSSNKYGGGIGGRREGGSYVHFTIVNTTITGNYAGKKGGGLWMYEGVKGDLKFSIVSGNTAGKNEAANVRVSSNEDSLHFNYCNLFGSDGNSGVDGHNIGYTDIVPSVGIDKILDTNLANNGGYTETNALLSNSPAIDAINNTYENCKCPGPNSDQRGYGRPVGSACDIGAYEYNAVDTSQEQLTISGKAKKINSDHNNGQVRIKASFVLSNPLDLRTASVEVESILFEANELLIGLGQLVLFLKPGSTMNRALFATDHLAQPKARLKLAIQDNELIAQLTIKKAQLLAPQFCSEGNTHIQTTLSVYDGVNPSLHLSMEGDWKCLGTKDGNVKRLRISKVPDYNPDSDPFCYLTKINQSKPVLYTSVLKTPESLVNDQTAWILSPNCAWVEGRWA